MTATLVQKFLKQMMIMFVFDDYIMKMNVEHHLAYSSESLYYDHPGDSASVATLLFSLQVKNLWVPS